MLNVPAPSFPVPSSQQRVSAGGRNKTPLKPGRSLMDWIKVKSSGKDLTGLKGRLIEVTEEELAKHNKKTDCWICIRGGKSTENAGKEILNGAFSNSKHPQEADKPIHPRYDWFQTDSTVTMVIYTKQKDMSSDRVTVDYQENILRGEITVGDYSYLLLIELSHPIQNFEVNASGRTGNVELILQKKDHNVWKSLGQSLEGHDTFIKNSQRGIYYRKCRLSSLTEINHNTRLFCFELPQGCHLQVPVGHHVYLKITISGIEVVKPYTPVSQALITDLLKSSQDNEQYLYMMIKIYPNGSFTPKIDTLAIGDYVFVSSPRGCFRTAQVEKMEDIFLVAAGTGFTPMVKLLRHVLNRASNLRKVKLIFFNKTENDILWREQLENLCLTDKRFEAQFILSEPSDLWTGYKGQISHSLLSEAVARSKKDSKVLTCICGPNGFIDQGTRFLEGLGFSQEEIFVFRE
ncbi:cytochrome b5 reductase 4 isoform X3 [Mixophyes fleayi]|uniref:cytochrome b5 reductase 4 isoform X3 n=1 Tax=Mixophyes fleayi TaxID=3061075 RepID=UPI003F4D795E